eukprot:CAMPEP_0171286940 /NCGR_PEP_ID=MMETSP0790-20130122/69287_1 /TAXON_ID=2925 /ORGANISM="Alexandrium catenella, Strain OF101" /LENGTH=108 /DNA_ID=CAMNT_0011756431 /DNA_START=81 /DNA_END=403 /DNA_ORIENTATION=+
MAATVDAPAMPIAAELGGTAEVPAEEYAEEQGRLEKAKDAVIEITDKAKERAIALKDKAVGILQDPQFQTCTITTAGGTRSAASWAEAWASVQAPLAAAARARSQGLA